MGYEYDVFISYKRGAADYWLYEIFMERFSFFLENDLGKKPSIFCDKGIQKGDTWPLRLQQALTNSRILVALLQPSYFHSKWCLYEFGVILEREKKEGYRSILHPAGLIQGVQIGDGIHFPAYAKQIQLLDCRDYFSASSAFEKSEKCLELEETIRRWTPDVAKMIREAPKWKASWINLSKIKMSLPKKPVFSAPTLE